MSVAKEFQSANQDYVSFFGGKGNLPLPPARKVIVITCMDARIDPAASLGLKEGEAHVIRNAGGRTSEALRSVIVSQQLFGTTEIVVFHHTDCGMLTFDNATLHNKLKSTHPENHHHIIQGIDFLPFPQLEQSVKDRMSDTSVGYLVLRTTDSDASRLPDDGEVVIIDSELTTDQVQNGTKVELDLFNDGGSTSWALQTAWTKAAGINEVVVEGVDLCSAFLHDVLSLSPSTDSGAGTASIAPNNVAADSTRINVTLAREAWASAVASLPDDF